jgi:membrane protease YdiL (CAAX protease family)
MREFTDLTTFVELAARGRTAWWRYLATLCLACVLAFVIATLAFLGLAVLHVAPSDLAAGLQQPNHPLLFFGGTALIFGALLAGLIAAARLVQDKRVLDIAGHWTWKMFFCGAGIWFAVQLAAALADYAIAPRDFTIVVTHNTAAAALYAVAGLSVQTFTEEFVFRGYLTQALLLATRRSLVAAVLSGLLFGLMHVPNGMPQAVSAAAFGTVCSFIAIRTGSIAFTVGLHFVNNIFGSVVVVSAHDVLAGSPGLIAQNSPQLVWWDAAVTVIALIATLLLADRLLDPTVSPSKVKPA